jgi:hypothetical protein
MVLVRHHNTCEFYQKKEKQSLRKHSAFNIRHTTVEVKTYFGDCGKEIFLGNSRAVLPDRKHSGFHTDCPEVCAVLAIRLPCDFTEVNILINRLCPAMNLED